MQKAKLLALQKIDEQHKKEIESEEPVADKTEDQKSETQSNPDMTIKYDFSPTDTIFNTDLIQTHFSTLPRPLNSSEIAQKASKCVLDGLQINLRAFEFKQDSVTRDYVDHYISIFKANF